jgi:hypothetical protein
MKKTLAAVLAVASVAALAPVAGALPMQGQQLAARIANGEFRGYTTTVRGFENQIWHFQPDGRIRAVADSSRLVPYHGHVRQEWSDIGVWRLEGDRVCVGFQGQNQNLNGCYVVIAGPGKNVRLAGPFVWDGTLEAYGY